MKHICIDFEGEGKRADGFEPHPSLLGALVPRENSKSADYYLWVFESELQPMLCSSRMSGKRENRRLCDLKQASNELLEMARMRQCRLVSYSQYELQVFRSHLPTGSGLLQRIEARYFNILPSARSLANRRRLAREDNTLLNLLTALSPSHKWPPPPACGPAEACRRLRRAGTAGRRWSNWSDRHKALAHELVAYNRGDCKAVWRLVNRVASNYSVMELNCPTS